MFSGALEGGVGTFGPDVADGQIGKDTGKPDRCKPICYNKVIYDNIINDNLLHGRTKANTSN